MQNDRECANYLLDHDKFGALADWLGDVPENVICVHSLRRCLCKAFAKGEVPLHAAAVIQMDCTPSEPMAYGEDPDLLFEVLEHVKGWDSVNVNEAVAQGLAHLISERRGARVSHCSDAYYVLRAPAADFRHHDVRELIPEDAALLEAAPPGLQGCGFGTSLRLLEEGVVACGIVSDRVVAIGYTSAITDGYADIGIHTAAGWRCRGFATACASIVADRVQHMGLTPVWSTGEDNTASIKIAEKIGFERVSRRACLVTER